MKRAWQYLNTSVSLSLGLANTSIALHLCRATHSQRFEITLQWPACYKHTTTNTHATVYTTYMRTLRTTSTLFFFYLVTQILIFAQLIKLLLATLPNNIPGKQTTLNYLSTIILLLKHQIIAIKSGSLYFTSRLHHNHIQHATASPCKQAGHSVLELTLKRCEVSTTICLPHCQQYLWSCNWQCWRPYWQDRPRPLQRRPWKISYGLDRFPTKWEYYS